MTTVMVGLLVGGRATRFGGVAKGMLAAPDTGEPLAARLSRICREGTGGADVVLLGRSAAYASLGLPSLEDEPAGIGPLGALAALLTEAERRGTDALAVATDLPYVTIDLVVRICAHAPGAAAVAPRLHGAWQPLFARYAPAPCLPLLRDAIAAQRFAARAVLEALGDRAVALPLRADERPLLDDWDTPEDAARRP
jgi:molybdopterin-guanine dinucleotide biosynthesis protein A